jgi:hypothetical protein
MSLSIRARASSGPKSQLGMGMSSWLIIVVIVGLMASQLFKVIPSYIDNQTLRSKLQELAFTPEGVESKSLSELRSTLNNSLRINNIRDVPNDSIEIKRQDGRVVININYEKRIPMFFNVDVLLTFKNQLDSKFPDKCCDPIGE